MSLITPSSDPSPAPSPDPSAAPSSGPSSGPSFGRSVIVRAAGAETIGAAPATVRLLADSSATGGALSTQRVTLLDGANGAAPHRHSRSSELSFLLDGTARLLSGEQVVTAGRGDLVVVPPGLDHAFAAPPRRERRHPDRRHAGHRAVRVLPPPGAHRVREGAARVPAGGPGALRHLVHPQRGLGSGPAVTGPGPGHAR